MVYAVWKMTSLDVILAIENSSSSLTNKTSNLNIIKYCMLSFKIPRLANILSNLQA